MSPSSTTRQAGESTRRVVTRTSLARSFSASFRRSSIGLNAVGGLLGLLLLGLVLQLAEVDRALGDALQRLAVELVQVRTASTRRRGRSAAAPRCPSCGRSRAAGCSCAVARRVGGDVVDRLLAFLHAARRSRRTTRLRRRASRRSAAAWRAAPGWRGPRRRLPSAPTPKSFQNAAYLAFSAASSLSASASSIDSTRLVEPSRIAFTSRLSCSSSRETLSGRSARVDHALDEAQVDRHQRLGVVHDEDALDVQLDAAALVAVPQVERRLRRDVEQLRVFAAALDAVVRVGERRLACRS